MRRDDDFLECVHRQLAIPGSDAASIGRAIDELLRAFGEFVPTQVAMWGAAIQVSLARGGILAARAQLESFRALGWKPRTSGVLEGHRLDGSGPPRGTRRQVLVIRYRCLTFEIDDAGEVQLLCLDRAEVVRVGEPRHARFLHHLYRFPDAPLVDAIRASGSDPRRFGKVYHEVLIRVGHEWFADSDMAGPLRARTIRFRPNRGVPGAELWEQRVRILTPTASRMKRVPC